MVSKKHTIELTVNGVPREGMAEARRTLADFLRDRTITVRNPHVFLSASKA